MNEDAVLDAEEAVMWQMVADLAEGIRSGDCSYDGCLTATERASILCDLVAISDEIEIASPSQVRFY